MFNKIGCSGCHIEALPLTVDNNPGLPGQPGWIYFEPNPYNPATGPNSPNLRLGPTNYPTTAPALTVDLTSDELPLPRLKPQGGVVMVPAYTDLKLHDISATSKPATDPECEPLDQNQPAGSDAFFAGNCKFITRKLWGFYNQGGAFSPARNRWWLMSAATQSVGPHQETLRQMNGRANLETGSQSHSALRTTEY